MKSCRVEQWHERFRLRWSSVKDHTESFRCSVMDRVVLTWAAVKMNTVKKNFGEVQSESVQIQTCRFHHILCGLQYLSSSLIHVHLKQRLWKLTNKKQRPMSSFRRGRFLLSERRLAEECPTRLRTTLFCNNFGTGYGSNAIHPFSKVHLSKLRRRA